jgi:hypothetical protein
MKRWFGLPGAGLPVPAPGGAGHHADPSVRYHGRPGRCRQSLSLADALGQARSNSPAYRQTLNDANPAKR